MTWTNRKLSPRYIPIDPHGYRCPCILESMPRHDMIESLATLTGMKKDKISSLVDGLVVANGIDFRQAVAILWKQFGLDRECEP